MATVAQRNIGRSTTGSAQHDTYQIAHTARCKLHLAANRPDRNLRFVLGHAFTLDNLLLRIVEIENSSAKDEFEAAKPDKRESEIQTEDDRKAGIGGGAGVKVGETGSLKRQPQEQKRRVSFGNSANFRPSDLKGTGGSGNGSPKRNKSPPPVSKQDEGHEGSESEEDFDPNDFVETLKPQSAVMPRTNVDDSGKAMQDTKEDEDDDDEPVYDYDDGEEDEDGGLGLQRFASASAQPPRRQLSPPPPSHEVSVPSQEDVPALSGSDSDEDEDSASEPPSPPSLPEDVMRKMMLEGVEDETLKKLYNQIRRCSCGGEQHEKSPAIGDKGVLKTGTWEGRTVGIVTVEA